MFLHTQSSDVCLSGFDKGKQCNRHEQTYIVKKQIPLGHSSINASFFQADTDRAGQ